MSLRPFDDRPGFLDRKIIVTFSVLLAANLAAWAWAGTSFAHNPALAGMAVLAYVFGLRHAFDADHIAAIDNVVRRLMQDGKKPFAVGLFFSLGHSTIVVIGSAAIALFAIAQRRTGMLPALGSGIGTLVSAFFLIGIGLANLLILRKTWAAFTAIRRGDTSSSDALLQFGSGGIVTRILGRFVQAISKSWHMYFVGFLFGLGFDTATEIGVLGISASQALKGLPIWTVMVFPALFTAGMSLMDTTDSTVMAKVYGWAFVHPLRKIWYNLTITATSVAIALFIGSIEAFGLLANTFGLRKGIWTVVSSLNNSIVNFGFVTVGIFLSAWLLSALLYRTSGMDDAPATVNDPSVDL